MLEIAPIALARIDDFSIRARDGFDVPVRLYVPHGKAASGAWPLVVFYHGGGFTIGDLETHDPVCRMLAERAGCLLLAVHYRRAPEYRFPVAVEDAADALSWAHGNARRLGADARRIALVGDSAGGTLATVTALHARDAGIGLVLQVLIYPGTAGTQDSASHRALAEGFLLDARTIQWFFGNYLRSGADRDDWRFAPLTGHTRPPLAGVAAACVLVADYDPLYDEGVAYAHALRDAGVRTRLLEYPGMVHGFFNFGGVVAGARRAHDDVVAQLREAFTAGEHAHGA